MVDMDMKMWEGWDGKRQTAIHQCNALRNWLNFVPASNIIVFVDSSSTCRFIEGMFPGVRCYTHSCMNDQFRLPQFNCVWRKALSLSETDLIMFANGDILFEDSLPHVIRHVFSSFKNSDAVIVGERTDIEWNSTIDFRNPEIRDHVFRQVKRDGVIHGDYAIDYFVFRKGLVERMELPAFLLGTWRWDNWLLSDCLSRRDVAVVDATEVVLAMHQGASSAGKSHRRRGFEYNEQLNKKYHGSRYRIGRVGNAHFRLFGSGLSDLTIVRNPDLRASVIGYQYATQLQERPHVAVLIAGDDISAVRSWVDRSLSAGFDDMFVLASNEQMYHGLKTYFEHLDVGDREGRPLGAVGVVYGPNATMPMDRTAGGKAKMPDQRMPTLEVLMYLLDAGLDIVAGGPDCLPTTRLAQQLAHSSVKCDVMSIKPPDRGHLRTSQLIVRSTGGGRNFFRSVLNCVSSALDSRGLEYSTAEIEDECINHEIFIKKGRKMKACSLPGLADASVEESQTLDQQNVEGTVDDSARASTMASDDRDRRQRTLL
eukprot:CAMPEP_0184665810 /NCGR_PEP_ID=MMETSP0308-20130426/58717_1 /TAXON_ID=38269 /ORGANISM="Gloeochaete witrockiana, Strain SAG 46.84" /LENGTH=538 /DNA_ID=CAMNT_0027110023 /DNA_START=375 /DNA_END=1991 /DNA_ORIENTATION=+